MWIGCLYPTADVEGYLEDMEESGSICREMKAIWWDMEGCGNVWKDLEGYGGLWKNMKR